MPLIIVFHLSQTCHITMILILRSIVVIWLPQIWEYFKVTILYLIFKQKSFCILKKDIKIK